jgi:HK97 family phage portal protein
VAELRRELQSVYKANEARHFVGNPFNYSRESQFAPTSKTEDYLQLYETYAHVFACVDAISRNCAKLPLRLYKLTTRSSTKDRRGEEITMGDVWNLFNQPNPYCSGYGLIYSTVAYLKLTGNAYLEKVGAKTIRELWTLRPDWMKIRADAKNLIAGYEYTVDGSMIKYAPEEVLRFKTFHPRSEIYGMAVMSPAQQSIITDLYAAKYSKLFFKQGGHLNWYVSVKEEMDNESYKRMEQQARTKWGGIENAHVPAILDQGAEIKELGGNPDNKVLLPQKTLSRDEVCEVFGVPALMLGLPNETHYNNAEAQKVFFWEETIQPFMGELVATINRDLLWPIGIEMEADYSKVSVLQPDYNTKAMTAKTLVDGRIMTPNEVREKFLEMDPLPGGDEFYVPPTPAPFGGLGLDDEETAQDKDDKTTVPAAVPTEKPVEKAKRKPRKPREEMAKAIVNHRATVAAYAYDAIYQVIDKAYVAYADAVHGVIGTNVKKVAFIKLDLVTEAIASLDPVTMKLAEDLLKVENGLLDKIIRAEYQRVKDFAPEKAIAADIESQVSKHLDRIVKASVKAVSETVIDRVTKHLEDGIASGQTAAELGRDIQDLLGKDTAQAQTIARTETLKYTETSRYETLTAMGFEEKEWIHSEHSNARPGHEALNGTVVKLGEYFVDPVTGDKLMFPGDPNAPVGAVANCGCTFVEYVKEAVEE